MRTDLVILCQSSPKVLDGIANIDDVTLHHGFPSRKALRLLVSDAQIEPTHRWRSSAKELYDGELKHRGRVTLRH
jgi:hypothetical protein